MQAMDAAPNLRWVRNQLKMERESRLQRKNEKIRLQKEKPIMSLRTKPKAMKATKAMQDQQGTNAKKATIQKAQQACLKREAAEGAGRKRRLLAAEHQAGQRARAAIQHTADECPIERLIQHSIANVTAGKPSLLQNLFKERH